MINKVLAAIENPALKGATDPDQGGVEFAKRIAVLWRTVIIVGGLAFVLYLLWGGIDWLTSGGDKGKVEDAKNKITHALVGLGFLAASYVIILLVEQIMGINLLNIEWPTI